MFVYVILCLKIHSNKPDVSVIVPVYNEEFLVKRGLDSILNQSLKNIEVICVDDGSKDNSLKVLNQYYQKDKRVIVIHQENCGLSCARNTGLVHTRGRYVVFVDSDDWIELEELEVAFGKAKEMKANVVVWGFFFEKDGRYYGPKKEGVFRGIEAARFLMEDKSWHTVWSKMYENSFLKNSKIKFDTSVKRFEDVLFNLDVVPFIDTLVCLNRGFYHYCRTMTGLYETYKVSDGQILSEKILERLNKMKDEESCKNCLQKEDIQFLRNFAKKKMKGRNEKKKTKKKITKI